jgi:hypothetical protein
MSFGEQWRLLSLINLSWIETSLGLFSEGLAPLLTDPPIPSAFGLDRSSDQTSTFCLLKHRNGYIIDRQKERIRALGKDGKPCLIRQRSSDSPAQNVETSLSDGGSRSDFNPPIHTPISIELVADSFQLDSFVQNDDTVSHS